MPADFNPVISVFHSAKANTPSREADLLSILGAIKEGSFQREVEAVRNAATKEERTELKKKLQAVTWSGIFTKRNKQSLQQYSSIICHDIDGLPIGSGEGNLHDVFDQLTEDPFVYSVFLSPSGNGLKVLFRLPDLDHERHNERFELLGQYLHHQYKLDFDPTGRDVCRLCFLSYDPTLHLNEDAEIVFQSQFDKWAADFAPSEPAPPAAQTKKAVTDQRAKKIEFNPLEKCHEMTRKHAEAIPGQHNKYANQYAIYANRYGVPEKECLLELQCTMPQYNAAELQRTVVHVYASFEYEHGKWTQQTLSPIANMSNNGHSSSVSVDGYDETVTFWYKVKKLDKESTEIDTNEYKISYDDLITFLQNNGFYKYRGENNTYQFIHVDHRRKIVDIVIERQIKEFILDYLKSQQTQEFKRVREMFRRGSKNYCSTSILEGLDYYTPQLRKDTKESGYIYFQNCFLEITAEGIRQHSYTEQENSIWLKQIKPFSFSEQHYEDCDFARFLRYAIIGRKADEKQPYTDGELHKYRAACTSIGYLLHRYKDPTLTKAIITTDKALRQGTENEGRSGKSLVGKALEYMLICTSIDGRNFSFDKDFAFQKVNIDTQLINFNDIKPKFDFTRLFGMITEEFTFEKKGKDVMTIPFEDAPKFYISSNSTLRGEGSSTRARQQIIEFSNYFNEQHTPVMEFGRRFFHGGWDREEWSRFYNFMAHCCHLFLKEGLLDFPLENYAINALYETPGAGEELVDFLNESILEKLLSRQEHDSHELFDAYKGRTTQKVDWLKKNTFTKWVKDWAKIKGLRINAHRPAPDHRDKRGGVDYWTFSRVGEAVAVQVETDNTAEAETELPF
jgi:hypothetical protein